MTENTMSTQIAISKGPHMEMLFSSRFTSPILLLVFSTSGLVLEFPIYKELVLRLKEKHEKTVDTILVGDRLVLVT